LIIERDLIFQVAMTLVRSMPTMTWLESKLTGWRWNV